MNQLQSFRTSLTSLKRWPPMLEKLLSDTLEPLFMLGFEEAKEVIDWAAAFSEREELYMGRPDDVAISWIRGTFNVSDDAIQRALDNLLDDQT